MTLQEIKNLEGTQISNLSKEELQKIAKDATRISKQRLSNLSGKNTLAKTRLEKAQGTLNLPKERDIDKMNVNELRKLITDERQFLRNKTSTLQGERERIRNTVALSLDERNYSSNKAYQTAITKRINQLGGYWDLSDIFDLIDRIREIDPSLENEIDTNTSLVGAVIESFDESDFINLQQDPKRFADKLREKYVLKKRIEDDIPF